MAKHEVQSAFMAATLRRCVPFIALTLMTTVTLMETVTTTFINIHCVVSSSIVPRIAISVLLNFLFSILTVVLFIDSNSNSILSKLQCSQMFRRVAIVSTMGTCIGLCIHAILSTKFGNVLSQGVCVSCVVLALLLNTTYCNKTPTHQGTVPPAMVTNIYKVVAKSLKPTLMRGICIVVGHVVFRLVCPFVTCCFSEQVSLILFSYQLIIVTISASLLQLFFESAFITVVTYPMDFCKLEFRASAPIVGEQYLPSAYLVESLYDPMLKEISITKRSDSNQSVLKQQSFMLAHSRRPLWKEILQRHLQSSDNLMKSVTSHTKVERMCSVITAYGVPQVLPNRELGSAVWVSLCRSLAVQDLSRVARSSPARRQAIYSSEHLLPDMVHSLCSIIDATAIQLQLLAAHGLIEVLDSTGHKSSFLSRSYMKLSSIASKQRSGMNFVTAVYRTLFTKGGDEWMHDAFTSSAAREAAPAPPSIKSLPSVDSSDSWALLSQTVRSDEAHAPCSDGVIALFRRRRESREETCSGSLLNALVCVFPFIAGVVGATLNTDPIQERTCADIVNAIDALSLMLVHATEEDGTRRALNYVPTVLCCMLEMEISLTAYINILRAGKRSTLLSSGSLGYDQFKQIKRARKVEEVVSPNLLSISYSLSTALNRIVLSYYDVIPTFTLPPKYAGHVKDRMAMCL
mmetsp:Transcript_1768/g.2776  ORF Transcript_1768/g.2776 Transcript_1768/m.2776 type:complete len:687 (+) Transcript_1768:123-2183(+)